MIDAFTAIWQDATARLQPQRTLLIGNGTGDLAASLLASTSPWGGLVDLAWPVPAEEQPPRDGHRFTMHQARPQDATGLLPVPDLVIVESADTARASGTMIAGVLNALKTQANRTVKPYPVVLLFGVMAIDDAAHGSPGTAKRPAALAALEDFVATESPAFVYGAMPLLQGVVIMVRRDDADRDPVRAIWSGLTMGGMAQRAAVDAESARLTLAEENSALREQCASAETRTAYLYAALRRAQSVAAAPAETPRTDEENAPGMTMARTLRRRVAKLVGATAYEPDGTDLNLQEQAAIERLRSSPLLSPDWYSEHYPDVAASGVDPAEHYYRHGAAEGRDPGPDFVTSFYLASEPHAAQARSNPLLHFLDCGVRNSSWPSPDFDPAFYLATNPDVADAGLNPLEHYVAHGRAEGRRGLPSH